MSLKEVPGMQIAAFGANYNLFIFRIHFYFACGAGSNASPRQAVIPRHKKRRLPADRPNLLKAFILAAFLLFRAQGIVSIFGYTYQQRIADVNIRFSLHRSSRFLFETEFVKAIFSR